MASRKPPPDPRQFVRLATDIGFNRKIGEVDDPAFFATYIYGLLLSAQSMTDGLIQPNQVTRLANTGHRAVICDGESMTVVEALCRQGLWHIAGHDCPRCPQPKRGLAIIHDYLQHQQSKADRSAYREAKSRAGKAGAEKRWGKTAENTAPQAAAMAGAMPPASAAAMADALARTPPPIPARPATRRRTRLPEQWTVNDAMRRWAAAEAPGVDIDLETKHFLSHYRGEGTPRDDWAEVWKAWMLRALKTRAAGTTRRTYQETTEDPAEALRRQEQHRA